MTISEYKSKLDKSLQHLSNEMMQIRTGRASPSILESLVVDAYGSKMTIREVGSITVLDTQTLVITPWDKSLISEIVKAIRESDLKLNPIDDKDKIRIPVPPLTEERRKELAKLVSVKVEDCKNSMRNVRQEAVKDIEKDFLDKSIGEDEKFRLKEEVDKIIKDFSSKADELGDSKKDELMKI